MPHIPDDNFPLVMRAKDALIGHVMVFWILKLPVV